MSITLTEDEKYYVSIAQCCPRGWSPVPEVAGWSHGEVSAFIEECLDASRESFVASGEEWIAESAEGGYGVPPDFDPEEERKQALALFTASQTLLQKLKQVVLARREKILSGTPQADAVLLFATGPNFGFHNWERLALTAPDDITYETACIFQAKGWIDGTYNENLQKVEWKLSRRSAVREIIDLLRIDACHALPKP